MQDRRCIYFNQPHLWRSGLAYCFKTGGSICRRIPNLPVCRAIYYSDVATALIAYEAEVEYIEDGETHCTDLKSLIERHSVAQRPCLPRAPAHPRHALFRPRGGRGRAQRLL